MPPSTPKTVPTIAPESSLAAGAAGAAAALEGTLPMPTTETDTGAPTSVSIFFEKPSCVESAKKSRNVDCSSSPVIDALGTLASIVTSTLSPAPRIRRRPPLGAAVSADLVMRTSASTPSFALSTLKNAARSALLLRVNSAFETPPMMTVATTAVRVLRGKLGALVGAIVLLLVGSSVNNAAIVGCGVGCGVDALTEAELSTPTAS